MNILIIAPHPDDEAIGCGGSVCAHVRRGDRVVVTFLTSGELGLKHLPRDGAWQIREAEAASAGKLLDVSALHFLRQPDWFLGDGIAAAAKVLRPILAQEMPGIIYLPHPQEWHPDHQASLPIVRAALSEVPGLMPELRMYEVWTPLQTYDHVQDITDAMASKLKAIRQYKSQLTDFRYDQAIRGLNRYRGIIAARVKYAEVFSSPDISPASD